MYELTKLQKQLITLGFVIANICTVAITSHASYSYANTIMTPTYTDQSK